MAHSDNPEFEQVVIESIGDDVATKIKEDSHEISLEFDTRTPPIKIDSGQFAFKDQDGELWIIKEGSVVYLQRAVVG